MSLSSQKELLCLRCPEERHLCNARWSGHICQTRVHYQVHMGTEMSCAHVSHALRILNGIECRGILVLQQNIVPNRFLFFKLARERWSQICLFECYLFGGV